MKKFFALLVAFVSCTHKPLVTSSSAMLKTFSSTAGNFEEQAAALKPPKYYVPRYLFNSVVDEDSMKEITLWLAREVFEKDAKAVIIEINSGGGSVYSGFAISKVIEAVPVPVVCVVDGEADSMAFYILQSCSTRLMTKRSILMAHEPSLSMIHSGNHNDWENVSERLRVVSNALIEHCAHRMNVSLKEFHRRTYGGLEWWFDWQDALKYGAVDGIVQNIQSVQSSYDKRLSLPHNLISQ